MGMVVGFNQIMLKQQGFLLGYSVLLAHFFIALGRDDAFWGLFWQSSYYQDLFFVTIIVFLVSLLIESIWKKLDQGFSWEVNFRKRFLLQVTAGVLLPTCFSALLVYGYMTLILKQDIGSTTYFYYEFPVSLVMILMLNLLLGVQYLSRTKIIEIQPSPVIPKIPVVVQSGNSKILLDPDDVFFIEKEGPICFVYNQDQVKYISPQSLDQLSGQLQPDVFFRTNRQTIAHRNNCLSFRTERSGKLILALRCPPQKKIAVSQKKAREFKIWLTRDT